MPPTTSLSASSDFGIAGRGLVLQCIADGIPAPNVTWSFNGMQLSYSIRTVSTDEATISTLIFGALTAGDEGVYTCTATNSLAELRTSNSSLNITVLCE